MVLFLSHLSLSHYLPALMALCWAADTVPISVHDSRVMSHHDKFLSTMVTSDFLGLNSEAFPRMNTLVHLGESSTNT